MDGSMKRRAKSNENLYPFEKSHGPALSGQHVIATFLIAWIRKVPPLVPAILSVCHPAATSRTASV